MSDSPSTPHPAESARIKWDKIYGEEVQAGEAAWVLRENAHLLPQHGRSLDAACGLGSNALFLARRGLNSYAWDISPVAVEKLDSTARASQLTVHAQARDIAAMPPSPESFEVIIVSFFLDRAIFPHLIAALTPGGLLYYQTYTRSRVDDSGPRNEAYRLGANELLSLCSPLRVLAYRDEGTVGNPTLGLRNVSYIVAQRQE